MARKIDPDAPIAAPASDADNPLDDLYKLLPDVPLTLQGRELTVHELSFAASQRARATCAALIEELQTLVDDGGAADAGSEAYLDLLARHAAPVQSLMLDSVDGLDADLLERLTAAEGEQLSLTWWNVAGRFFWRAVVGRLRDRALAELRRRQAEMARKASAGPTSSSPSPAPAEPSSGTSPTATANVN